MGKFNLDDYETVQSRINRFKKDWPNSSIRTELLSSVDKIGEYCFFKAFVVVDANNYQSSADGVGHAYEKKGDGYINKTSWVENCETSAIGRALANMGYGGDKRATREEMMRVQRMENQKPVLDKQEKTQLMDKAFRLDPETIDLDTVIPFGKYKNNVIGDLIEDPRFESYVATCLSKSLQSDRNDSEYWSKIYSKFGDMIQARTTDNELDQALSDRLDRPD